MLKADSIGVGHACVNERIGAIREIVEELDRWRIKYNEFDLQTGSLIPAPFQIAYRSQVARWAKREARSFEMDRLHRAHKSLWLKPPEPGEIRQPENELGRVNREQIVGSNASTDGRQRKPLREDVEGSFLDSGSLRMGQVPRTRDQDFGCRLS